MKSIAILLAFAVTGCVIESDPDPEPEPSSTSYENHVYLECNGSVVVDRTFTSKSSCEDFRANNEFYCGTVKLSFSC